MTILKALHNQSGVQKMSVQIQPDDETIAPMANVVFVGIFKRGRVDCPFKVTEANYRAKLGYDPRNKVFQAIEDAFKTGISSVWVQRVANISDKENNAPWGDWVLNSGVVITGGMARYTSYKTNGYKYFDSFADIDLTDAIIRSFHDADMQQWQGFKDAANELTGVTDWVVDSANSQIEYINPNLHDPSIPPNYRKVFKVDVSPTTEYYATESSAREALDRLVLKKHPTFIRRKDFSAPMCPDPSQPYKDGCAWGAHSLPYGLPGSSWSNWRYYDYVSTYNNNYDPDVEPIKAYVTFNEMAQKIISNLQSPNEGKSLLVEAYLDAVANSIFNPDESKQFLKLSDLIAQFEQNKILRT